MRDLEIYTDGLGLGPLNPMVVENFEYAERYLKFSRCSPGPCNEHIVAHAAVWSIKKGASRFRMDCC